MCAQALLNYYQSIIPDISLMRKCLQQPLPLTCWLNISKSDSQKIAQTFQNDGIKLTPFIWHPYAYRVNTSKSLGRSWQYVTGLLQIQEEVSMLPPFILNPKPTDKVLDLCAAPGNKTVQMAVMMQGCGTLVANDKSYSRLRALSQTMKRFNLYNISTSSYDGMKFPGVKNFFDKILLDAPCSGEGTIRKQKKQKMIPSRESSLKFAKVQLALLSKALQLCKVGGRIVYSTCTFAPEENERVIDQLLKLYPDQFRVLPIVLNHFKFSPGITLWQKEQYNDEIRKTARIWPHLNDTGGFYIALLEKTKPTVSRHPIQLKVPPQNEKIADYLQIIQQRYAIDNKIFSQWDYLFSSSRGIYISNHDRQLPANIKLDATGLFFQKTKIQFPKLTTAAAMLLGKYAQQNVIELNVEQRDIFLNHQDVELAESQISHCTDTGYVIIKYQDYFLGQGLYFTANDRHGPVLRSLFPRYLLGPE